MRMILQRVLCAQVEVAGNVVGKIGRGTLVLVGIDQQDTVAEIATATEKLAGLRIFEDETGKMNLDSKAAQAEFLIVSQFTVVASLAKGRRPSFTAAAHPDVAENLIESMVENLRAMSFKVATGRFGARMQVKLTNDGPATFVLDIPFKDS